LLAEGATLARDAGVGVLHGRGDEAEREFPFGVALQLLEAPLHRADAAERAELFAGAAELARPLLEAGLPASRGPRGFEFFSLAHGLYWLTQNLAETGPLLVLVDDIHCADTPSLRFLAYLARRIGDLPIALVTARRLGEQLRGDVPFPPADARPLRLKPLSPAAVARVVRLRLPDATDAFCAACARATAGNPLLLEELLRTVVAEGLPPTDEGAAEVRAVAPDAVSRFVLLRLSRFAPEAVRLARATAVIGEAPLADAARLAGLDRDQAHALAAELVAAGVLADRELLAFSHPIVREAVHADITHPDRATLHLRAAELLRTAGAPPERVSAHLLAAPPSRDPGVVEPLRVAAGNAIAEGAPESAVRYLRRALEEPPAAEVLADVLMELGEAEAAAAEAEAPERFRAAIALRDDPPWRARVS
jgi:hypothetical protein